MKSVALKDYTFEVFVSGFPMYTETCQEESEDAARRTIERKYAAHENEVRVGKCLVTQEVT